MSAFTDLFQAVEDENTENIFAILAKFDLENIERFKSVKLFCALMNKLCKNEDSEKTEELIIEIINYFNYVFTDGENKNRLPLFVKLFGYNYLTLQSFLKIFKSLNKSLIDFFEFLIIANTLEENTKEIMALARNITLFYPKTSKETWQEILSKCSEEDVVYNESIYNFVKAKIDFCSVPDWIIDNKEKLIFEDNYVDVPEEYRNKKQKLGYRLYPTPEKIMSFGIIPDEKIIDSEIEIFRIFGPVNTCSYDYHNNLDNNYIKDRNHPELSNCKSFGGCRMLTCCEFEIIDSEGFDIEDDNISDWFRGSCDFCDEKIAKKHYAVRKPLIKGGWQGCFCSKVCIEKSLFFYSNKEHADDDTLNLENTVLSLITTVFEQINKYGIYDE